MLKQIPGDKWNPSYDEIFLCVLDFTVGRFTEKYGITFEKYLEDGLGECYFACVEIQSQIYILFGACNANITPGIAVKMQGNNPSVDRSIGEVVSELNIVRDDLLHEQEHYAEPKWQLFRQGDDGNEVEIDRFHDERVARHNMRIFEARGHKQYYNVRELA